MTAVTVEGTRLTRGQEVQVSLGLHDLGTGKVDDFTDDGLIVWIVFGGATPRRMFLPGDRTRFTAPPPDPG